MSDGRGWRPDSRQEWLFVVGVALLAVVSVVVSGLDSQIEYVVESPSNYFSVADTDGEGDGFSSVVLDREQISGLNFVTQNSLGMDSVGSERGFCGGVDTGSGDVFDLRFAEGVESSSRDSIVFSCVEPRSFVVHSQPDGSKGFSDEDLSFDGEFRPRVSCVMFSEAVVSPVSGRVSGLSCVDLDRSGSGPGGFLELPVYAE